MVKRRETQEREEADARERAEGRREALLAELKAREAARRAPVEEPSPATPPEGSEPADTETAP